MSEQKRNPSVSRRSVLKGAAALAGAPFVLTGGGLMRPARASVPTLQSGPMLGHATQRSAWLWFQTSREASFQIEYWPVDRPSARGKTPVRRVDAGNSHTAHVLLPELRPGSRYAYRLILDGKSATERPLQLWTDDEYRLWEDGAPTATILAGSCAYTHDAERGEPEPDDGRYVIYETMAGQGADAMLWLGDNVYFRSGGGHYAEFHRDSMDLRYRNSRALPQLQSFLQSTRHFATWDDHDFGPNNTGREWMYKDTSAALFRRYWANPSYGLPGVPGIFTVTHVQDMDIFLLDGRYHRDDRELRGVQDKQMFGPPQLRWLQNALLQSRARFKLICSGSQVLNDWDLKQGSWNATPEGWRNYPAERDTFMRWLRENDVRGVLFVSGDRHFTELLRQDRPGTYPLYDITTSPLTSGPPSDERLGNEDENPLLVSGTLHNRRNFCRMDLEGGGEDRALRVRVLDTGGTILWEYRISAAELGVTAG